MLNIIILSLLPQLFKGYAHVYSVCQPDQFEHMGRPAIYSKQSINEWQETTTGFGRVIHRDLHTWRSMFMENFEIGN